MAFPAVQEERGPRRQNQRNEPRRLPVQSPPVLPPPGGAPFQAMGLTAFLPPSSSPAPLLPPNRKTTFPSTPRSSPGFLPSMSLSAQLPPLCSSPVHSDPNITAAVELPKKILTPFLLPSRLPTFSLSRDRNLSNCNEKVKSYVNKLTWLLIGCTRVNQS